MAEKAQEIQAALQKLQSELHEALVKHQASLGDAKNQVYSQREVALPQPTGAFWAKAIVGGLTAFDAANQSNTHFLGPYDARLLQEYLTGMDVRYKADGRPRLTLNFREGNPFFEERSLWAEQRGKTADKKKPKGSDKDEDEEEEEEDEDEDGWIFSGVTWRPGHGPEMEDEMEEEEKAKTSKRPRDESATRTTTVGPSFLDVFSEMPPHPEVDDELRDLLEEQAEDLLDEEETGEAPREIEEVMEDLMDEEVDKWEEEMDDRIRLLALLVEDIYEHPAEGLAMFVETPAAQKQKAE